jgi:hypothetical protein
MQAQDLLRWELVLHLLDSPANANDFLNRGHLLLAVLARLKAPGLRVHHHLDQIDDLLDFLVVALPRRRALFVPEKRDSLQGQRDPLDLFESVAHEIRGERDVP